MDKLDFLILSELLKDAQTPFSTVAKKLGTSPYTVAKRYEKMVKDGRPCILLPLLAPLSRTKNCCDKKRPRQKHRNSKA